MQRYIREADEPMSPMPDAVLARMVSGQLSYSMPTSIGLIGPTGITKGTVMLMSPMGPMANAVLERMIHPASARCLGQRA